MKSIITWFSIVTICLCFSFRSKAQSTFNSGDNVFNLGIGLAGNLYAGGGYATTIPPIGLSFEHGLNNSKIGIGGFLGVASSTYSYDYGGYGNYSWRYTYKIIAVRGAYHFYTQKKFDVYAGALLGYNAVSFTYSAPPGDQTYNGYATVGSGFAFDIFVGGRYYFTQHFGVMAELGYGVTLLTIGIALKL
jgi:hypothetical protein